MSMMHKCFLCPLKNRTLKDDSIKCSRCGAHYHSACAKRAMPDANNVFNACCGDVNEDVEDEEFNQLDSNLKLLYQLLCKKIDEKFDSFKEDLITVKSRLSEIEERLDTVEEKVLYLNEDIITEITDRLERKNNILIFNMKDSKDSANTDKVAIINLLSKVEQQPPFDLNSIIVSRMGNKFVAEKPRPIKVSLPLSEHVHWVLKNKKHICKDVNISITTDSTVKQREFRSSVLGVMNDRKKNGEEGLFIKYVRGVPTIASNSASNAGVAKKKTGGVTGQKR